jgi:hypothetical protein
MPIGNRLLLSLLIGKRWAANGRGPDEFDCWQFACHVERDLFGRDLPSVDAPADPVSWFGTLIYSATRWQADSFSIPRRASNRTAEGTAAHDRSLRPSMKSSPVQR